MIYTTYFARLRNLPRDITPISICGKAPDWYAGLQYKKLAPKYGFFKVWKETHDNDYYIENFNKLVLFDLDPQEVYDELMKLAKGEIFALVCYERPGEFCHRHLVADWFNASGFQTMEYGEGELS